MKTELIAFEMPRWTRTIEVFWQNDPEGKYERDTTEVTCRTWVQVSFRRAQNALEIIDFEIQVPSENPYAQRDDYDELEVTEQRVRDVLPLVREFCRRAGSKQIKFLTPEEIAQCKQQLN